MWLSLLKQIGFVDVGLFVTGHQSNRISTPISYLNTKLERYQDLVMSSPSKNMLPQAQSQAQRRCRKSRTFKNCGTLKALRYLHIESKLISIIFAALVMDTFSLVLAQGEIADLLMESFPDFQIDDTTSDTPAVVSP